ncbi:MAG: LysR family transcriptional regulator [Panacagrimonas sp.]
MDIPLLEGFAAVAEQVSVSRAAQSLHITQPSLSKRIRQLESHVGQPLFDRIGRQLRLNEAGRVLLPHARRVLAEVEDGRRALAGLSDQVSGRLSIGTSHHIGLHRLPNALRHFVARYPQVELDIHFMDSEQACLAVQQGKLELGIVTLPPEPIPQMQTEVIWPDPMAVLVAGDHLLAEQARVTTAQLAQHPALLPDEATYTHRLVGEMFRKQGLQPRVLLSTNYLETIKMLVSIGLGWSVLPLSMCDDGLRALPLSAMKVQRELGLAWHAKRSLSNAARAMCALLRQQQVSIEPH